MPSGYRSPLIAALVATALLVLTASLAPGATAAAVYTAPVKILSWKVKSEAAVATEVATAVASAAAEGLPVDDGNAHTTTYAVNVDVKNYTLTHAAERAVVKGAAEAAGRSVLEGGAKQSYSRVREGGRYRGWATFYGDGGNDPGPFCTPNCGHCGPNFIPKNRGYFAAIHSDLFSFDICGACAYVYKDGKQVVVPVVDSCPTCNPNSLDLSHQAFSDLVGGWDEATRIGLMQIEWEVRPCGSAKKRLLLSSRDRADRLARLRKHSVNLDDLHPSLRSAVLADFLEEKYPQKRLLRVVQSFNTAMALQRLVPDNPSPDLLPLIETKVLRPGMAPELAQETMRLFTLGRRVFSLFWHVIFRMLPSDDDVDSDYDSDWEDSDYEDEGTRQTALNCNEVFAFTERRQINWELSGRDFRAQIAFELETKSPYGVDYTKVVNSSAFAEFWKAVKVYPDHPAHQKSAAKASISRYLSWKKSSKLESVLKATFDEHGVEMRDDSKFIDQFCEGKVFCDPEQVVATLYLTGKLFEQSHVVWSQLRGTYEARLKRSVYEDGKKWMEAVKELTGGPAFRNHCQRVQEEYEEERERQRERSRNRYRHRRRDYDSDYDPDDSDCDNDWDDNRYDRSAVVADFLKVQYPKKRLLRVVRSFNTAMALQRLVPDNPSPDLLPLIETKVIRPGMAPEVAQETMRLYTLAATKFLSSASPEVVAMAYLKERLLAHSPEALKFLRKDFEGDLRFYVYERHQTWMEAVKELTSDPEFEQECEMATETLDMTGI
ncbi:hypothetical protein HDU96_001599 [Phlyctochytrium bullatum]|nr:hypothetical protein HDU96_001599 [Phlyctochytrium bullatum]